MQSQQTPEQKSYLLKVTKLISSGKQGLAARGRVSNLSGVQAAARLRVRARMRLAGVWSGDYQGQPDLQWPRSLLLAPSWEAF